MQKLQSTVHIINYTNIVQCAKTVHPARHDSINGRVASNLYPIPYIYHSFALSEMQRTQPISYTIQYPELSCKMFWLDIRLFLEPCQYIISCASKQLCFRSTDVTNPIIFHSLHSVNKINTCLSLPYPLGSVVHLIFDSKCTSSLHQD